ncbi:MAG TPA: amidohydrolase family protein [Candidatus Dormibacteraeota bacterium]|nr:amidohydrolase family protein [Candidatus Dormibacteraeota bacterium]
MEKIDAFAHVLPERYRDRLEPHLERTMPSREVDYYRAGVFHFDDALTDLDVRLRRMEAIPDYRQILVLAVPPIEEIGPPPIAADFARLANDEMAELVRGHPDRFAGFVAALPLSDVEGSLREIDRAAGDLGAVGALVYTNVQGVPLDDHRFEPILSRLEALGRGLWLHPTRNASWADYRTESSSDYGLWWSLGWPYETAAALSRLVYSGIMERHPSLKVIAHHGAGMVPHFAARLGMGPGFRQVREALKRAPLDYFRLFHADTALFGAANAVECVLGFFGPEHVLFGTDTPLGPTDAVERTIADIDACDLSDGDRSAVYSGNARRLLQT